MSWLPHVLGLDNGSGAIYLFYSGVGANFGELAIVGALVTHYKRHTCHVNSPRFCWRPGVHPVEGAPFKACGRHHPTVPSKVTAAHIASARRPRGGP